MSAEDGDTNMSDLKNPPAGAAGAGEPEFEEIREQVRRFTEPIPR